MVIGYTLSPRFIGAYRTKMMRGQHARRGIFIAAITTPARDSAL
jgi:hypothetical protein